MNKQYQHNGKTYNLKPLTLSVMKRVMPLLARLRKLQHEYTKDIDMSGVNLLNSRIAELETAKNQLSKQADGEICHEERLSIADKINSLNEKISAHKAELNLNESFNQKIKLFNECSAMALLEIISDKELIKPVMETILIDESYPLQLTCSIDYDDPESLSFLSQVLTGFFLSMLPDIMKFQR